MPTAKLKVKSEKLKVQPSVKKRAGGLSVDVYDVKGRVVETITLPKDVFGVEVKPSLLSQAVRVYLANQRSGTASTKTRGEVQGSSRKIYRQKGTGRARHGSIRAPIFVKGGIVFGPKPRDYSLSMPQKMRKLALFGALTSKQKDGEIKVLTGLDKMEPKTKIFVKLINVLSAPKKRKVLFVTSGKLENASKASRNIPGVEQIGAQTLNAYRVLQTHTLLFTKDSLVQMEQHFVKGGKNA